MPQNDNYNQKWIRKNFLDPKWGHLGRKDVRNLMYLKKVGGMGETLTLACQFMHFASSGIVFALESIVISAWIAQRLRPPNP